MPFSEGPHLRTDTRPDAVMPGPRVVIGYDGSGAACRALEFAAGALAPDGALVVNVFADPGAPLAVAPIGGIAFPTPSQEAALEQAAQVLAEEGAARARMAGLTAQAATRRGAHAADVARALHDAADEFGAALVVIGHCHDSLLETALHGSVSGAAIRDGRRPVLVVPASGESR